MLCYQSGTSIRLGVQVNLERANHHCKLEPHQIHHSRRNKYQRSELFPMLPIFQAFMPPVSKNFHQTTTGRRRLPGTSGDITIMSCGGLGPQFPKVPVVSGTNATQTVPREFGEPAVLVHDNCVSIQNVKINPRASPVL